MSDLLLTINTNREQEITAHYASVVAEIDAKTKAEPLRTKFDIYTGCPTKEIAEVVTRRLNASGIKATVATYGFFITSYYLQVEIELPESLAPETPNEPVVDTVTEEVVTDSTEETTEASEETSAETKEAVDQVFY